MPFPPENNLHNFRIATTIFSRTQMPYKRFFWGHIKKKLGEINPRGDKRKREWVHSESVTSHRNLSIYPHCVDFPAANKKESFVSNQFLSSHKKGTVYFGMVRIRNMMNAIPKTFITSEQPIFKLTQGVGLHRKGNLMVRIRITNNRQPFVHKRYCTKKENPPYSTITSSNFDFVL